MNLDTVYDWITAALDKPLSDNVIRENDIGPKPSNEFITFEILNVLLPDYEYWTKKPNIDEQKFDLEVTTRAKFVFSINVYANEGIETLKKLKMSPYDFAVETVLKNANVSFIGMSQIRNLTSLGDTAHVRRFQADFTFYSTLEETYTKEKITQYYITGKWDSEDVTIDVPKT